MKKRTCWIVAAMIVLLAVFGYSLWQILDITGEYRNGSDSYGELEQFVAMPGTQGDETADSRETDGETTETQTEPVGFDVQWPAVDFDALAQVNDDIVAWLYVPGTVINYPVVQGTDNDYYLNHLFNGQRNSSGCIFMDYFAPSDFSARNSTLHGHHMRNGTMFAGICKYKTQSYYDEHPLGLLLTPEGNFVVQFFSGYVCRTESDAWQDSFGPGEYEAWLAERLEQSAFECGVTPTTDDRVLTLSTCTYEFKDARFVLHGVLTPVP